ncbi:MAG TPA: ketopantoate reductase C-terminal domain-containing protein, partial [Rectinemataceae bacterium]|nr:ketopantoate reductase C-terminal domain-containing protein [Rectinemataceae bacterium]
KIVVNLANTVTSLVGQGYRPIDDLSALQRILSKTLAEGVRIVEAAGYRSHRIGSVPGFGLIRAMDRLPAFLTRAAFARNLDKMVRSSMSQDLFQRGRHDTELESLTGYILRLAAESGVAAPWNEGIYQIAKERFAMAEFRPLEASSLLASLQRRMALPQASPFRQ